jgi:hypothetical protein
MQTRKTTLIAVLVAAAALGASAFGMYLDDDAQDTSPLQANFTNAAVAEVRDSQGTVLLRGDFALAAEEDDDVERKAVLTAAGADTDATGDAEVEFPKTAVVVQEVEFSVKKLAPETTYAFVIDGKTVATEKTGKDGSASVDLKVKMPAGGAQ